MVMAWLCELADQGHRQLTPYPALSIGRRLHPFHKLFQTSEHMLWVLVVGLDDLHHGGAGDGTGGDRFTHLSRFADAKAEQGGESKLGHPSLWLW